MKEYHTAQRNALAAFFREHKTQKFSIDALIQELPSEASISRSAIYRNLDRMVQDGLLTKSIETGGRKTLYQFEQCHPHCDRLHLRCEKCGKTMHLKSSRDESDLAALLEKSGFELDEPATTLLGICKDCKQRGIFCPDGD